MNVKTKIKGVLLLLLVIMSGSSFAVSVQGTSADLGRNTQTISCQVDHFTTYLSGLKINDQKLSDDISKLQSDSQKLTELSASSESAVIKDFFKTAYLPDLHATVHEFMAWKKDHKDEYKELMNSNPRPDLADCGVVKKPAFEKSASAKVKKDMKKSFRTKKPQKHTQEVQQ